MGYPFFWIDRRKELMKNVGTYLRLFYVMALLVMISRSYEVFLVALDGKLTADIFISEAKGMLSDFMLSNVFLLVFFPVVTLLKLSTQRNLLIGVLIFSWFITVIHVAQINYFVYQYTLLDIFLYQYTFNEILFTIKTSGYSYISFFVVLCLSAVVPMLIFYHFNKKEVGKTEFRVIRGILMFSAMGIVIGKYWEFDGVDKFELNKSVYFYKRSIEYWWKKDNAHVIDDSDRSEFQKVFNPTGNNDEYPFIHPFEKNDVLGPLMKQVNEKPNIVLLIVEGLSNDFIQDYHGMCLMPKLKKRSKTGLYWKNFFSVGERSFAAIPSLLGGLPYGVRGFTMEKKMPYHHSLVSILKEDGYCTHFFYGQSSWFHSKDRFFKANNVDLLLDKSGFSSEYKKVVVGDDDYFWGYNDEDLFDQSLTILDSLNTSPRLDVYFTGTSHSPFVIADTAHYEELFQKKIGELSKEKRNFFEQHREFVLSTFFVDDALEEFFNAYQKREDFGKTIFIITGDHPMTELPIENSLKRYHVPLIIASEMVDSPKVFSGISSHLDLYESLLSFLGDNYQVGVPGKSTSLGRTLNTTETNEERTIAFMNDNREIVDVLSGNHFLSNGKDVYQVDFENFSLKKESNSAILNNLSRKLNVFNGMNDAFIQNQKLLPEEDFFRFYSFPVSSKDIPHFSSVNAEYIDLVSKVSLQEKVNYFDLFMQVKEEEGTMLVWKVTSSNDSLLEAKYFGLGEKDETLQMHEMIRKVKAYKGQQYFSAFLWNQKKEPLEFEDLSVRVYGK